MLQDIHLYDISKNFNMEWFALLIPILLGIGGFIWLKRSLVWWEIPLPLIICIFLILGLKACVTHNEIIDNEYWGSLIKEARYYEAWETWVGS